MCQSNTASSKSVASSHLPLFPFMPPQDQGYGEAQNYSYQGQNGIAPAISEPFIHNRSREREQETSD